MDILDYKIEQVDYETDLPKHVVEEHDGFQIVRDDLLDGGTKRRAFTTYVKNKPDVEEFVYASPRQGYAQLSLAYACKDMGRKSTVTVPQGKRYWLTDAAEELGCNIIEVPMGFLTNIQAKARYYCQENNAHLIPFGGDHPIIVEAMRQTALSLNLNPTEVWTVMSSGVLSRGLQGAQSKKYGVRIGHNTTPKNKEEQRLINQDINFNKNVKKMKDHRFKVHQLTIVRVDFMKEHQMKVGLFWNVGK